MPKYEPPYGHPHGMFELDCSDAVMPALQQWLEQRGLELFRMPRSVWGNGPDDEDATPCYGIMMGDKLNARTFPDSAAAKEWREKQGQSDGPAV